MVRCNECKCQQLIWQSLYWEHNPNLNFSVFICQTLFPDLLCFYTSVSSHYSVLVFHILSVLITCFAFVILLPPVIPNTALQVYPFIPHVFPCCCLLWSILRWLPPFFSTSFSTPTSLSFPIHSLRLKRSFAGSWRRRRRPVCTACWETYWGTISTTTGRGSCRVNAVPEPCAPKPCCTSTKRSSSSALTASSSRSKSTHSRYSKVRAFLHLIFIQWGEFILYGTCTFFRKPIKRY